MQSTNREMTTKIDFKQINEKMRSYPLFYRQVWLACAQIPEGETRTYGWIAEKIGHPKAARAVGQALAANPFAPTIPCHRVIGANGRLTGYSGRGGLRRKKSLLRKEGVRLS